MSRKDRKCHSKWRIIIIKALVLLFSGPDNYCADISNDAGVTDIRTLVSAEFEVVPYLTRPYSE